MKVHRIIALAAMLVAALPLFGQQGTGLTKVDTLVGRYEYAEAYKLAQEQYRHALSQGGRKALTAAFRLTALDEAYSKTPADSALLRYRQLASCLQGADRAVANAFLCQTYMQLYSAFSYLIDDNESSDDPLLPYSQWHRSRWEDTLLACAGRTLQQPDLLRATPAAPYGLMAGEEAAVPVMDSSLLGMLVAVLTDRDAFRLVNLRELGEAERSLALSPFPIFRDGNLADSALPLPLRLHRLVAQACGQCQPDAMLWLDLNRLAACYGDTYLVDANDRLESHYATLPLATRCVAWLAYSKASAYSINDRKVEAEQICLAAEAACPGSHGADKSRELREYICRPEVELTYDITASSRRSRLAMVEARNVGQLDFRLVPTAAIPDSLRWSDRLPDMLRTLPATTEWHQQLPDPGDHLAHRHLVALPPVPQGDYYIVAMADTLLCHGHYNSSDAAFIAYSPAADAGKKTRLTPSSGHVVDRLSGQPLAGRRVTLTLSGEVSGRTYTRHCRTDKEGYFHFPSSSSRYLLADADDIAVEMDGYEHSYPGRVFTDLTGGVRDKVVDIVITDRPVYRLGDTVRFCAVAYSKKTSGEEWHVDLRPASGVKLDAIFVLGYSGVRDTLHLTTDRHGRCWGQFVVPPDGRNGRYRLELMEPDFRSSLKSSYFGSHQVEVTAYKQPHFTVTLSTIPSDATTDAGSARRFGQPITVYGVAKSFSGAPMGGAKVKWEVSRERMVNPWQMYSVADEFPHADSLVLGDDGMFQFSFTPEADSGTFIYTAYARVIDADGELHEQSVAFHVSDRDGYCVPTGDDLGHLAFAYNNFDHQPIEGAVRVELFQLRQPDTLRCLAPLMKIRPDARWVGTRDDFRRHFPHLAFDAAEADPGLWPVVAKRLDTTTALRQMEVDGLPSGVYRVRFSCPDGSVTDTLMNHVARGGRVTGNDLVWHRSTPARRHSYDRLQARVGDTVRIEMGSPFGNQPLYYSVSHAAKVYRRGMMVLDSSRTSTLAIPIVKGMEDGVYVTLSAMRDGRQFSESYSVDVVDNSHLLAVGIETFRDRLQPGERERWRFHIASADTLGGKSAAGVEANICLTMYDKSLDEFAHSQYVFWPWFVHNRSMETYVETTTRGSQRMTGREAKVTIAPKPLLSLALPSTYMYLKRMARLLNPDMITATVIDAKTKEPLPFVNIVLKKDGREVKRFVTDFDGNAEINLPEGEYDLEVRSVGYKPMEQRVSIGSEGRRQWNISLSPTSANLDCVLIVDDKMPLIEISAPENGVRLSSDDIARMPMASTGYSRGEEGMVTLQGNVTRRVGVQAPKEAIAEISAGLDFGGHPAEPQPSMRKNLTTLALFEPALRSDKEGNIEVEFVLPDALIQWRLMALAWTDRYSIGELERTLQAQKALMVQPLMPRFLRQGDTTEIPAKVANLTDSTMRVEVTLQLGDTTRSETLTVAGHSSAVAQFRLPVGKGWHVADYKLTARSTNTTQGHCSDGEQGQLPVLSDRERVTRSHLLYIAGTPSPATPREAAVKVDATAGDTVVIAFNANPMEYAVQALPHFGKHRMPSNLYLANSIYVNHLLSVLGPLDGKERKRMASRVRDDMTNLMDNLTWQGGWSWMPGGKEPSMHITTLILERLAPVPSLHARIRSQYRKTLGSVDKALVDIYLDTTADGSLRRGTTAAMLPLLYARSLYLGTIPFAKNDSLARKAFDHCYLLCRTAPVGDLPLMVQGRLAMLMLRMGDTAEAVQLARRIKGTAHIDEQRGMYWVTNIGGYGRYQRPVETASLMVDVFADVLHDWESAGRIQQWILSEKQGTTWKTDMATACAVAALLRQPADSTRATGEATLTVNGKPFAELKDKELAAEELADMDGQTATIDLRLTNPSPYPAWGAVFCSREEPIDSIRYDGTGIGLRKTLSLVAGDGSTRMLAPGTTLRVGDRVRIHIDIQCKRDMENMVLADQRAAAFEPVSTESGWHWNDGLRYYVDVRDDRLDCYIDRLDEGHYYVEYDLWVRHAGVYANGIGTLRSAYAPEFRANTSSETLRVDK